MARPAPRRGQRLAEASASPRKDLSAWRIFTPRQVLAEGRIDGLGGQTEPGAWPAETHGISASLRLKAVNIDFDEEVRAHIFGGLVGKTLLSERLRLDGLVSLWHPVLR